MVTTNSGFPLDRNLYQAVKGIAAASSIVKEGGDIFCIAECSDGVPEDSPFHTILGMKESPEELLAMITGPGFSMMEQWQVQKLGEKYGVCLFRTSAFPCPSCAYGAGAFY